MPWLGEGLALGLAVIAEHDEVVVPGAPSATFSSRARTWSSPVRAGQGLDPEAGTVGIRRSRRSDVTPARIISSAPTVFRSLNRC